MDFYCERINLDVFNEPLNIVSNIFFLITSIIVFKKFKSEKIDTKFFIFPTSIFFLSIGSALFHTLPNRFTLMCDVVPIFIFCISFIFFTNKFIMQLSLIKNYIILFIFIFSSLTLPALIKFSFLNGSQFYLTNYLILFFYILNIKNQDEIKKILIKSFLIFNTALFFRTIDNLVCGFLNIGTHFVWHFFSSVLLFYLSLIFIKIR
ncbi:MAG: hypothetical protein CMM91_07800 [Rickettsiales bacterium]|nr:hypothetical protein [Rickettsiales bacterium]